jgi:serine/threonine-protein kinase
MLYMAPEQAAADPTIDGRADIYALGVTAYEMLTGAPPFAGLPARAMLAARMSAEPPSVRSERPDVPVALSELLRRCLASDPADRPQSAQELVNALEMPDVLSGEHLALHRPLLHPPSRRILVGLAAVALLGVGVATAYTRTPHSSATAPVGATAIVPRSEVAVVPFVDLGDSSDASLAEGLTNAVAGNLAKSGHVRVVSPSAAVALVKQMRDGTAPRSGTQLVLEGTVQRENGRLRVTARLSNASDGVMRWADVFDRNGHDVFAVTDDIAAAIVASVASPKT